MQSGKRMSKMLFLMLTSIRKPEISAKEGQQATPMDWHLGLGMSGRKSIWSKKYEALGRIPEFSARRCFWNNCFPSCRGSGSLTNDSQRLCTYETNGATTPGSAGMAENPITILFVCAAAVYTDPWDPDDASGAAARCYPYAAGR